MPMEEGKRRANAKRLANRDLVLRGLPTRWLLPTLQRECQSLLLAQNGQVVNSREALKAEIEIREVTNVYAVDSPVGDNAM